MKRTYAGPASFMKPLLKQLDEKNIPWESAGDTGELGAIAITCDVQPVQMVDCLDEAMNAASRILPIPEKVITNQVVCDLLMAHGCHIAVLREDDSDTSVIDSEELYPDRFADQGSEEDEEDPEEALREVMDMLFGPPKNE